MTNIIVVLPKLEDAKGLKNILVRNGFQVTGVCTTGAQAISQADGLHDGIVICSYKMMDMVYDQLHECLPGGFEMLLLASQRLVNECYGNDIVCLSMPLKVNDLNLLNGFYVNLEYHLPNGHSVKLLEDNKVYMGNQIQIPGTSRCYGIVADEEYLLVCEYGCDGTDPQIVVYKRREKLS